jgi:hypothetical protein
MPDAAVSQEILDDNVHQCEGADRRRNKNREDVYKIDPSHTSDDGGNHPRESDRADDSVIASMDPE